uniref:Uncharacterized protein n=1 Tax=Zosterops lateralis melanops TaxID=1220523 RepID=A0A8D2PA01_ZOSLA
MALGTLEVALGTLGTLGVALGVALSPLSPLSPVVFGEHSLLVTVSGQKLFVVKRHHHVQEPVAV